MNPLTQFKKILILPLLIALALVALASPASATLPPGNTVAQWNKIAEDTVVGSGAFQAEGFIYMAYASAAVYDAVVAIEGGYEPYGPTITAPPGASVDCAVIEAAYRTLRYYFSSFPVLVANLDAYLRRSAPRTSAGAPPTAVRALLSAWRPPTNYHRTTCAIRRRADDADRCDVIVPDAAAGTGRVAADAAVRCRRRRRGSANVRRFILASVDQFLPDPPPSLQSDEWVEAFNEIKAYGAVTSSVRTEEQTDIAKFWSANVVRQYNGVGRDIAAARGLDLLETARLAAMVNLVGADALGSALHAKYHYLFWRPVTAIDPPPAVITDGFGPVPGYDDGNPATVEQAGWRPLLTTPNHPEYPCRALHDHVGDGRGVQHLPRHQPNRPRHPRLRSRRACRKPQCGAPLRHAERASGEVINARIWAGLHYRFSGVAGVVLGRQVAKYDLRHAFQPVE